MIIAIDGYEANIENRVGIGHFAFEILRNIYSIVEKNQNIYKNIYFSVYIPDKPASDLPQQASWWQYKIIGPKKFWTFIGLPWALLRERPIPGVIFSPTHYAPRFVNIPRIISVMDLSYITYPDLFRSNDLYKLVNWTKYSVNKASKILTISEFSKNAIIKAYNVSHQKVEVTYPGLSMVHQDMQATFSEVQNKYSLPKHYILSVGTLQPRKNYVRLIEAFSIFLKKNKMRFGVISLVIVGKKGWMYEEILKSPYTYNVSNRVQFLDYVPDNELPTLYKHALCFALPSLYEGFGLPVLEAMSQGCPVLISNVSSLPEIAGKAGVYVDPNSTDSIASGILSAVRQRNLMQGRQRIKKGLERVREFSWENAASKTLEIIKEVATQKA